MLNKKVDWEEEDDDDDNGDYSSGKKVKPKLCNGFDPLSFGLLFISFEMMIFDPIIVRTFTQS